jgi:hypothetical protein
MIDAEKRLLAHALEDPENQHFVLLSERCVLIFILPHRTLSVRTSS